MQLSALHKEIYYTITTQNNYVLFKYMINMIKLSNLYVLEIRRRGDPTEGSNPSLSASEYNIFLLFI